ncbi:MAG: ATP synthase F1 subunit epsilon [Candidatus Eremiobacterota bacterium]
MAEKQLTLEIVTPEAIKFSGEIKILVTPGPLSSLGVLPDHISLLTTVLTGETMVRLPDNREIYFAMKEGLLEVNSNHITLLVDEAAEISDINIEEENILLEKIRSSLLEAVDNQTRERLKKELQYILARINICSKGN